MMMMFDSVFLFLASYNGCSVQITARAMLAYHSVRVFENQKSIRHIRADYLNTLTKAKMRDPHTQIVRYRLIYFQAAVKQVAA